MDGKLASLALTNAAGRTLSVSLGEDYDANGNVTAYRTETRGYAAQYAYDAFGNTVSSSGPMASFFALGFSTKYYDFEPDLYYYGYRFYSPVLGRWLSRDPIEEEDCENLYATCRNNMASNSIRIGPLFINHAISSSQ